MGYCEDFRKHATDCMQMADIAPDAGSRADWQSMAARWLHLADGGAALDAPAQPPKVRTRRPSRFPLVGTEP